MSSIKRTLFIAIFTVIFLFIGIIIAQAKTVEITTETLNLRKEATTDSDIVALISIGDECEVLGEKGDWYKVKYKDHTGYISKEYAKVIGDESNTSAKDNNETQEKPTNTDIVNDIKDTTIDESKEETSNSMKEEDVTDKTSEEDVTTNKGKTNKDVDVKIVPLINGSKIGKLKNNSEVMIISKINGWTYIQTDTISGWVRSENVTQTLVGKDDGKETGDKKDETTTNTKDDDLSDKKEDSIFKTKTMYAKDIINIRKEPNTTSSIIMVVDTNTELKVIGESGNWYKVNTSSGDAYISKDLLSDKKVTVTNRGNVDRTEDKNNNKEAEDNTSTSDLSKEDSSTAGSQIVSYAKKFLGVPYIYGGASPSGFDCSGFTMYVYKHFGISMAHGAQSQAKLGKKISADKSSKSSLLNNLKPGDLVFFLDYETMDEIGHCGIYIGDGNFIHASSGSGYCVKINSLLPGEYYNSRYCGARRVC